MRGMWCSKRDNSAILPKDWRCIIREKFFKISAIFFNIAYQLSVGNSLANPIADCILGERPDERVLHAWLRETDGSIFPRNLTALV